MSEPAVSLYTGWVMHARLRPARHRFRYRVYSLMVDLDRLGEIRSRLLAVDRPGLMSFRQSDHGEGEPDLAAWARRQFGALPTDRLKLFCFPRVFGYTFNPLALYFGYDKAGRLSGILYQVTNTFGDRHSYLIPAQGSGRLYQRVDKALHVSPFNPAGGAYRFRLADPGKRFGLTIVQEDAQGRDTLVATHQARAEPATERRLLTRLVSHPLMTWKVMAAIHAEAGRLFLKGMGYHRRPKALQSPVSRGHAISAGTKGERRA